MAYKYYNNLNSSKSLYLGSDLTKLAGSTGATLTFVGLAAGLGYGAWSYGSDISSYLFGSSEQLTKGASGLLTEVTPTAGLLGAGGFANTLSSWGTSLWGDVKSVADYIAPGAGKVAVAVAPVALTSVVQSSQQKEIIKAKEDADKRAIAAQAEHDKAVVAGAQAAGIPESLAKLADMFGIAPQNIITYSAVGGGALILILLLTKRKRG